MSKGTIMAEKHPDEIRLISYLESPHSDEFRDVRQHLITCTNCRKTLTACQTTIINLKKVVPPVREKLVGEHPDELTIADYVDGRLHADRHAKTKQHISGCGYCTKAALHYAAHSTGTAQIERETVCRPGILSRIFSFRIPAWIGVPATAFATAVLVLVLSYQYEKKTPDITPHQGKAETEVLHVLPYQDKHEVVFTTPGGNVPGIGFFGGARQRTEPFSGVEIQPQDNQHIILKWAEIKNARFYEVKIFSTDNGSRTLIDHATTSGKTEVSIKMLGIVPGRRYEWELVGQTADGGSFLTRGGLVVGLEVRF